MFALISTLLSWLACRFRSRAALELELIALRQQVSGAESSTEQPSALVLRRWDAVGLALSGVAALPPDHGTGEGGNVVQ